MPRLVCFCEKEYDARQADINRGWSKTCSKRCAAVKREFGRPNARHLDGSVVKWGKKPDYSTRHKKNAAIRRDEEAKRNDYYPFSSPDEMYEAMCDDPIEGR